MYRLTLNVEELAKYNDVSSPYDFNKIEKKLEEKSWAEIGNYEVGGGIRSTVLDLLKYGQVYLENGVLGKGYKNDFLSEMWKNPFHISDNSYYGYAFKVTTNYFNTTLVEHGGGQPGVSSNFGYIPEKGLVVSVLCNVSNVAVNDTWLALVNTALQLPIDQQRFTEPKTTLFVEDLQR